MDNEIIDISEISLNDSPMKLKSTNFGGGLELLMNDKMKEGSKAPTRDIHIDDLENL